MSKWIVVYPDNRVEVREDELTLEAMQEAVQGDIEALPSLSNGIVAFVNETKENREGKPLPTNAKATTLMRQTLWPGTRLVGAMILSGAPNPLDESGTLTDLTDDQVADLQSKLA